MALKNDKNDFVNRKSEFMFINEWVNTPATRNKGIFVYAKSGIGKSRFVSEFFNSELLNYIKIKVDILGTDPSTISSYSFLMSLYRKIVSMTEKNGQLSLAKRVSTSAALSIGYIAEVNFSFSLTDKYGHGEQIGKIMSYLTHRLSEQQPYIIDIENFQLIDTESLECFMQLFQVGTQHRYIFEFTMDPHNITPNFYHIFSKVSSSIECQIFELKKLKLKEINILCERKGLPIESATALYENNDGNLFPLVMLEQIPQKNSMQPLHDLLNSLNQDQLLILFLIELACGEIKAKTIVKIFSVGSTILAGNEKYKEAYLQTQYYKLEQKKIVRIVDDNIKISQDQILELIKSYRNLPNYYLAWSLYENFHEQQLSHLPVGKRESSVLSLLHIYTVFPDVKIYNILPELTSIILQQPPKQTIEKICLVRKKLELQHENRQLNEFLIQYLADICIAVGQWPLAFEQIKDYYSENIPWQACYLAATIAACPQIPNAEKTILRIRQKHKISKIHYMSLTVSLLSYYLRTVPELKVRLIAEQYMTEFRGSEDLNYAFILKMYSNTQDNETAIQTLEHANRIFRTYQREDLIIMNQITIASRNVYMGRVETGEKILENVEKAIIEGNIPIRSHYILNNKNAIHLLTGHISHQTEQDLTTAFLSTGSNFEKAIILCNLMIYFIQSEQIPEATKTFYQIQSLELSQYNNVDLEFILLKNTLFYYTITKNKKSVLETRTKLVSFALSDNCPDDIRQHIMSILPQEYFAGLSLPHVEQPFFANFPFQADFIGYWQCEVCYDARGENRLKKIAAAQDIMHFES